MKDLLPRACVVIRTSNMKISRHRLTDYVKKMHLNACCTCSTIIFLRSTNHIISLQLNFVLAHLFHQRDCIVMVPAVHSVHLLHFFGYVDKAFTYE